MIESLEWLLAGGDHTALKALFHSDMHRSLINMIDRVVSVPFVKGNELLQRRMRALLQKNYDSLPYVIKDCLESALKSHHGRVTFFSEAALLSDDKKTSDNKALYHAISAHEKTF